MRVHRSLNFGRICLWSSSSTAILGKIIFFLLKEVTGLWILLYRFARYRLLVDNGGSAGGGVVDRDFGVLIS